MLGTWVAAPPPTWTTQARSVRGSVGCARRRGCRFAARVRRLLDLVPVCKVEAGDRVPSTPILIELARRLDVSVEELAGRDAAGSIPAATILLAEMSARLGEPDAGSRLDELEAEARRSGDRHALSRALEARGLVALERRDDERAIAALEQARSCDPGATPRLRPTMFEALGRAYAGVGDLSRGIALLRTALEDVMRAPADVPAAVRFGVYLASAYTDQGRFAEAEVVLADLIELEPRIADPTARARLQWTLARTYAEQGRLRLAERYGREVLSHLEESEQSALRGRAHLLLGQILLDQRRRTEADEELTRAEELMRDAGAGAPELAMLNAERGRSALLAGDIAGAQAAARGAWPRRRRPSPRSPAAPASCSPGRRWPRPTSTRPGFCARRRSTCSREPRRRTTAPRPTRCSRVVEERAGNPTAALARIVGGHRRRRSGGCCSGSQHDRRGRRGAAPRSPLPGARAAACAAARPSAARSSRACFGPSSRSGAGSPSELHDDTVQVLAASLLALDRLAAAPTPTRSAALRSPRGRRWPRRPTAPAG